VVLPRRIPVNSDVVLQVPPPPAAAAVVVAAASPLDFRRLDLLLTRPLSEELRRWLLVPPPTPLEEITGLRKW
jgi:hypothetical protein